ncbi:hypothetical protein BFJ71_g8264 [Fusarium oxysporum]|nr:hypothetical protein BFJ71_g8264 [Fusarium oxysporum]
MERTRRLRVDELPGETEHPEPSFQGSSFNNHGFAKQFNAPNGTINNSTGPGNHLTGSIFNGSIYVDSSGTKEHSDPLRDCLRSLAFPEMVSRFHDIDNAAQGTCEWLLRHKIYIRWASCDRGLLWIKGKPGSGKSTLLRYALANITEIPNTGEGALILPFFFHGRGSELQKTPLGLFRSLLHQLLRQVPEALTDLMDTFQQRCETIGKPGEKWQWHPCELRRLFESSLLKVLGTRPVWLFVDALDESGQKNAAKLAREFTSLLQGAPSTGSQFHICFACRHFPILDQACQFEICLEDENGQDISTYVRAQLSVSRVLTASKIPDLVTKRAQGVFIWAYLVVNRILDLDNGGAGLKQIEDETYSIPPDLDDLYHDLIRNMDERLASLKLVQWICFAVRPLSLDELQWAMIVDADCPHKSSQECKRSKDYMSDSDRIKRRVQTLSCGLAEVTLDTEVVQFIHQSAKDFFLEKGLSALGWPEWVIPFIYQSAKEILIEKDPSTPDDSPRICLSTALTGLATAFVYLNFFIRGPQSFLPGHAFPLPIVLAVISAFWLHGELVANTKSNLLVGTAHHRLSRTCIRYLAMEEMEEIGRSASQKSEMVSEFPFLRYATASWVAHTKQSDARSVPQDDLLEYFAGPSNALVERWVRIYRILKEYSDDCPPEGTSLVHVMSRYRVAGALRAILKKADQVGININAKDSNGRTPLSLAAAAGHEAIVRLLLDRGAHIEAADKGGRTPLSMAVEEGHEAVVRLLLDRGAYIEATDKHYRRTPLSMAVEEGHEAVVRLLLDRGAYTEAADKGGRTPLWWAAWQGHEAVVRLLLDWGAFTEAADQWGSTPLWRAAAAGHEAVVRLLLDRGAYTEAADKEGRTPLWWAAWKGHEAVVRLLLDWGSVTEAADQWGSTPLWRAAAAGHEAIMRLLLDRRAYTEAADQWGSTPLWRAAAAGHEAVVRLLLDRGAYIEATDKHYRRTPLLMAVEEGHEAVVRLLLDRGAHIKAADMEGRTPLSMAVEQGHEAVVRLLSTPPRQVHTQEHRRGQSWPAE